VASLEDDSLFVDDPVTVYLGQLHTIPPLSRDEEIECVQHIRTGDQLAESAKKRLAEAHLLLVVSIAERYRNDRIDTLELIQKGNEGLLRAVQTLGDSGHDCFSAHATGYIERAIADAADTSGSTAV
jgi:DNA-directed RNA polymerase sigma subunit (sigma70/sigma32)